MALLVVAGALPATSFTTATLERDASISTAPDEAAVVELDVPTDRPRGWFVFSPRGRLLTVTNWFDTPLDVTVRVTSGNAAVSERYWFGYREEITLEDVTQRRDVWFTVDDVSDGYVTVTIEARGTGISVRLPARRRTW